MDSSIQITLKNNIIKPASVTLNLTEPTLNGNISNGILLRILDDNQKQSYSYSESHSTLSGSRKYIFTIEQLDQQTDPLSIGDTHIFNDFNNCKSGKYHLVCLNYPKIQCQIQLINNNNSNNQESPTLNNNDRKSNTMINLSGLESVQEKQEENKEDFGKEENQCKSQQQENNGDQNPLGTPKKADIQDFDKILSNQVNKQETTQNKYLRYFQEQFRIWRNFFNQPEQQPKKQQQIIQQQVSTPTKQKPKSEHRKNSDIIEPNSKIDNWSKRQNYSPDLKYTLSCGSPSNNENLSEFQKQQDKTVLSLLHSQDNYRNDCELQKQPKTMKKTNSEYRLNIQDIGYSQQQKQKRDSQTDAASKKKQKKVKKGLSFIEWLDSWAQNQKNLYIKEKQDQYLIKQWIGYMGNKYKIGKFIHG